MKRSNVFHIQLKEPWKWPGLSSPDDPLRELSDVEMGLRRFCFDNNRKVQITIGDETFDVFLDPDISLILDRLPDKIADLSSGRKAIIELPESFREIRFSPYQDDEFACSVCEFGKVKREKTFILRTTLIASRLKSFTDGLIESAISENYITNEQVRKFFRK